MNILNAFGRELAGIILEMSPYLLLGFVFAGIMHVLLPEGSIKKYLGGNNFRSILNASLLGVPLPLCSCGVIPTGISFYRHGASKASTVSFLISTPQTGIDSIMVTWSLLGLPFAIIRPIVAFITGLLGGLFTKRIAGDNQQQVNNEPINNIVKKKGFWPVVKELFRYPFIVFMQDISRWLVIGLLLAALISIVVPDNFFSDVLPGNFAGMILMLVIAIPVYICATASVPIAAVLMMKGLSPGAALVLLMAGPATNAATITMIGQTMGKKTLISYLVSIIAGALFFGAVIDYLLPASWFSHIPHAAHAGHNHEIIPMWLKISSAAILTFFILNALIKRYITEKVHPRTKKISDENRNVKTVILNVNGMTCNHCRQTVENSVKKVNGVGEAIVDLGKGTVKITGKDFNTREIIESIERAGYKVVKKD